MSMRLLRSLMGRRLPVVLPQELQSVDGGCSEIFPSTMNRVRQNLDMAEALLAI